MPGSFVVRRIDAAFVRLTERTPVPVPAGTPPGKKGPGQTAAVGALFPVGPAPGSTTGLNTGGEHFCTASVVHSPAGDLAVTAAHCVTGSTTPVVFVPGYHDGTAPYGTWLVTRVFTDAAWQSSQDPDDDVAFLQLAPSPAGASVESVTGAERLVTGDSEHSLVRVIGYPETSEEPVSCVNWTQAFSPTQMEFDCDGYSDGTSGGPFLTNVSTVTGASDVIGVVGGYEQGGNTDAVSFSVVFGSTVAQLYQQASGTK
jgi:V8-like Glu-specific endopeptidase